ncbi:threonine-phosphate decarboxylase CobD [Pannonibacter sp.]|uniref:threonine-phosphate decarboxylase CobD n=1 Tax=Pannonibacter sp. TaxID=1906786 RepID=UPI003F71F62D
MRHGGDLAEARAIHGGERHDWLDLSTGINPHAWPVPAQLEHRFWTDLPSSADLADLLAAARHAYAVPSHLGLVAAPGTQAILPLLPRLAPEGPVAIVSPTYSSHADAWRRAGREILEIPSAFDAPPDTKVLVLVNPNNPDGRLLAPSALLHLASEMQARGGLIVVDEAFADVVPGLSVLPHLTCEPVLVLRSFGKFFGLAGLRLGFLAGRPDLADKAAIMLESWAVSGPALALGQTALRDTAWQDAMRRQLADEMADLTLALSMAGLTVFGGTALYALAGLRKAEALHTALARRHIWTRRFEHSPTWLRFGLPGSPAALVRLSGALAEAVTEI